MVISQDGIAHKAIKIRFLRTCQWCGEITTMLVKKVRFRYHLLQLIYTEKKDWKEMQMFHNDYLCNFLYFLNVYKKHLFIIYMKRTKFTINGYAYTDYKRSLNKFNL